MFRTTRFFYLILLSVCALGCKKELLSSDKALLSFSIESKNNPALTADLAGTITGDTVTFILPSDTMSKKLIATVKASPGARVVPGDQELKDFSRPVLYTIAAPDGTVKNFMAVCKPKTSLKKMLWFKFEKSTNPQLPNDVEQTIVNDTIKIRLPEGMATTLTPAMALNPGATMVTSITSADFSKPVHYTIKAEDGSTKTLVTKLTLIAAPKLKGFMINNACGAYEASTDTYYFPVTPNTVFNGYTVSYDTVAARYLRLDNTTMPANKPGNFALSIDQTATIEAYDEFGRSEKHNLIITGLPIVQLKTSGTIGDAEINAGFTLTDPDYAAHGGAWFLRSNISIKVRGATSRTYPKKQYAVKTLDENFASQDKPLFGLRNDNSWILDAMYIDRARMRNRLCTDIWNSMNNVPYAVSEPEALNGTRGYMTEVFLNNEYLGMYCLTEKLDRKQLKAKKNGGAVYKADAADLASYFIDNPAYNNNDSYWAGWSFDYPEIGDSPAPNWKPLYDFVTFVAKSSDATFTSDIAGKVYIDNLVDYLIFINATGAVDNQAKNYFFSYYDKSKDGKFFFSVWDLDATFGRTYNGEAVYSTPSEFIFLALDNNLYARLLNTNAGGFKQKLKARWNVLKSNQLSKSSVNGRIEAFRSRATSTNAEARENKLWSLPSSFTSESQFMTNWYNAHYDWLDSYINSL